MRARPTLPEDVGGYVVARSRGWRRLHLLGACPRIPEVDYFDYELFGEERPAVTDYDDYCRNCWGSKGAGPEVEEEEEEDLESASDLETAGGPAETQTGGADEA